MGVFHVIPGSAPSEYDVLAKEFGGRCHHCGAAYPQIKIMKAEWKKRGKVLGFRTDFLRLRVVCANPYCDSRCDWEVDVEWGSWRAAMTRYGLR